MIDIRGASGGSSGGGGASIPGGFGRIGGGAGLIFVIVIVAINVLGGGNGGTGFDLPGLGGSEKLRAAGLQVHALCSYNETE